MAKFSGSYYINEYVKIVKTWHAGLTAMGWVQTEDTNQLDEDTGAPLLDGLWGRTFWTPGDGLGGLVLQLAFFTRSRSSGTDQFYAIPRFAVGNGTTGEGALTGIIWGDTNPTTPWAQDGRGDAHQTELVMGGDASGFYAALGANLDGSTAGGTSVGWGRRAVLVDRSRDANGVATSEGAAFLDQSYSTSSFFAMGKLGSAEHIVATGGNSRGIPLHPMFAYSAVGGAYGSSYSPDYTSTPVFPTVFAGPGCPTWVSPLMIGVQPADEPLTLAADIAGRTRNYRKVRLGSYNGTNMSVGPAFARGSSSTDHTYWPMMLWED